MSNTIPRALLLAALVGLASCSRDASLTPARPRPGGCRVDVDGSRILCGGQVAATLRCTLRGYASCNVLVLTFADGKTVTLHDLRNDPKFDVVTGIAVEQSGNRIWFTESDLSLRSLLWSMLGYGSGSSSRPRVFDVWTGVVQDGEDASGPVSRGEAVRLASEERPTPGRP